MLVLISHNRFAQILWFIIIIFFSCNDANYELDNEFDPENLDLEPPTIFFHPAEINLTIGDQDSLELYCYEVDSAGGAHLQIEFDAEVITIDTVKYGQFFMNGFAPPIMFVDQEDGYLNVYLFIEPSLSNISSSGTSAMAKVVFTANDEGSAPLRYTNNTVFRKPDNNNIVLNTFGEGSINATQ
jgi:hypothetical protein|tara:strand:+ start:1292 stop:1843 length:552 start_codon:yes stop_codon:yes gene_type:complete